MHGIPRILLSTLFEKIPLTQLLALSVDVYNNLRRVNHMRLSG